MGAIGCPVNAGLAEPPTWADGPFKDRLGSELRRACSGRGSQSMTSPPWRVSPAYSSPSQPLRGSIVHYIMPQKSTFVKLAGTFPKASTSSLTGISALLGSISGIADPCPSDRCGRRFREGLLALPSAAPPRTGSPPSPRLCSTTRPPRPSGWRPGPARVPVPVSRPRWPHRPR
jgi:hypothetical protein